jgi:hypothetical protein
MRLIGFEVLVAVFELNVAGSDGFEGLAVVFDVVGAKTCVSVADVDIAIGGGDVAAATLCSRFQLGDTGFRRRKMNLQSPGEICGSSGVGGQKGNQENQGMQRGESLRTGWKNYPEHAVNESSWIA